MVTLENIIETRKEQSKGRYNVITSKRGNWYRSEREQLKDAEDLRQCIDEARKARLADSI